MTRIRFAAALVALFWIFAALVHAVNACTESMHEPTARATAPCHDAGKPAPDDLPTCCEEAPTLAASQVQPRFGAPDEILGVDFFAAAAALAVVDVRVPPTVVDRHLGGPAKPSRTHLRHRALLL